MFGLPVRAQPEGPACPRCKYLLRGLPQVGRCPECGFDYDPWAIVIRLRTGRRHYRDLSLCVFLAAWVWWEARPYVPLSDSALLATLVIVGVGLVYSLHRILRAPGSSRSLIINAQGVRFDDPNLEMGLVGWDVVHGARCPWLWGKFTLHGAQGKKLFSVPAYWLGGWLIARRCAREIERLSKVYRGSGDQSV